MPAMLAISPTTDIAEYDVETGIVCDGKRCWRSVSMMEEVRRQKEEMEEFVHQAVQPWLMQWFLPCCNSAICLMQTTLAERPCGSSLACMIAR